MQGESLEALEKADVSPVQARAILQAIEIELAGAKEARLEVAGYTPLETRITGHWH